MKKGISDETDQTLADERSKQLGEAISYIKKLTVAHEAKILEETREFLREYRPDKTLQWNSDFSECSIPSNQNKPEITITTKQVCALIAQGNIVQQLAPYHKTFDKLAEAVWNFSEGGLCQNDPLYASFSKYLYSRTHTISKMTIQQESGGTLPLFNVFLEHSKTKKIDVMTINLVEANKLIAKYKTKDGAPLVEKEKKRVEVEVPVADLRSKAKQTDKEVKRKDEEEEEESDETPITLSQADRVVFSRNLTKHIKNINLEPVSHNPSLFLSYIENLQEGYDFKEVKYLENDQSLELEAVFTAPSYESETIREEREINVPQDDYYYLQYEFSRLELEEKAVSHGEAKENNLEAHSLSHQDVYILNKNLHQSMQEINLDKDSTGVQPELIQHIKLFQEEQEQFSGVFLLSKQPTAVFYKTSQENALENCIFIPITKEDYRYLNNHSTQTANANEEENEKKINNQGMVNTDGRMKDSEVDTSDESYDEEIQQPFITAVIGNTDRSKELRQALLSIQKYPLYEFSISDELRNSLDHSGVGQIDWNDTNDNYTVNFTGKESTQDPSVALLEAKVVNSIIPEAKEAEELASYTEYAKLCSPLADAYHCADYPVKHVRLKKDPKNGQPLFIVSLTKSITENFEPEPQKIDLNNAKKMIADHQRKMVEYRDKLPEALIIIAKVPYFDSSVSDELRALCNSRVIDIDFDSKENHRAICFGIMPQPQGGTPQFVSERKKFVLEVKQVDSILAEAKRAKGLEKYNDTCEKLSNALMGIDNRSGNLFQYLIISKNEREEPIFTVYYQNSLNSKGSFETLDLNEANRRIELYKSYVLQKDNDNPIKDEAEEKKDSKQVLMPTTIDHESLEEKSKNKTPLSESFSNKDKQEHPFEQVEPKKVTENFNDLVKTETLQEDKLKKDKADLETKAAQESLIIISQLQPEKVPDPIPIIDELSKGSSLPENFSDKDKQEHPLEQGELKKDTENFIDLAKTKTLQKDKLQKDKADLETKDTQTEKVPEPKVDDSKVVFDNPTDQQNLKSEESTPPILQTVPLLPKGPSSNDEQYKEEKKESEKDPTIGLALGIILFLSTLTAIASDFTGVCILLQWDLVTNGINNAHLHISNSDPATGAMIISGTLFLLFLACSFLDDVGKNKRLGYTLASFFQPVKERIISLAPMSCCGVNKSATS